MRLHTGLILAMLLGGGVCLLCGRPAWAAEEESETAPASSSRFGSMAFHRPQFGSQAQEKGSFYRPSFGSDAETEGEESSETNSSKYGRFGNYSGSSFTMGSSSSK